MGNAARMVFLFAALALVCGGMLFVMVNMFGESQPVVMNQSANDTANLVQTVGISATTFLVPGLILIAVLVVLAALFMIKGGKSKY